MVMPKRVARLNRTLVNRVVRPVARWAPGMGVVGHRGRRSGRTYRTPVSPFATDGGYVIALIYGADTDWVRNVVAAGGCELQVRGRRVRLSEPRVVHDEARGDVPRMVRPALRLLRVDRFLHLRSQSQET